MNTITETSPDNIDTGVDLPLDNAAPEYEPVIVTNSPTHELFAQAIAARCEEILAPAGVPADLIPKFAAALAEEVDHWLAKFAAGQAKHGGDIRDRDLLAELTQEIRDAMSYLVCMRLQRAFIKVEIE